MRKSVSEQHSYLYKIFSTVTIFTCFVDLTCFTCDLIKYQAETSKFQMGEFIIQVGEFISKELIMCIHFVMS